ncbi:MAG: phosphoglucosamine mutase [Pyrinomonadaceae bacterium]
MKPKTNTKLFGTDGIRARAGEFPLDPATVRLIGASLALHLYEGRDHKTPRIVIGRDTRESGALIEEALAQGAGSAGATVESAGVITTPGVAFLARSLPADAGVVISASHNPYPDNGIKIFTASGRKLDDATERKIETDIARRPLEILTVNDDKSSNGRAHELRELYLRYLRDDVAQDVRLNGLTMVVDCANGAASEFAPRLFGHLGARVTAINNQPDGHNINLNCGSLHIEGLQERVVMEGADLGIAFDGDADRALFVDAAGRFVDGDATMWVLANYMHARRQLEQNVIVSTVMTNLGLELALRARGIGLVRTDVGDKYVLDELLRLKASLGGEQSGHIIFPTISLAGDGMITAISLLRVMRKEEKSLAGLTEGFDRFPQILLNVRVRERIPFEALPKVQERAHEIKRSMGERGRLLLRYSGTEPLARVMIEGEDEAKVNADASSLAALIKGAIGASDPD